MLKIKKGFLISTIIVVTLFQSCGVVKDSMGNRIIKDSEMSKDQYDYINGEVEITEKLILKIGETVLRSHFKRISAEAGQLHIRKVKNENIYIVEFKRLTADGEPVALGGAYDVAINGENGAILKIWGQK